MIKNYYLASLFLLPFIGLAQVGINTSNVDPSAVLEMNVDNLPANNKKGFLGPRVALRNKTDVTTIPSPALGLLVYSTTANGSFPNNISANKYYFWDGAKWNELALTSFVEEAVVPRLFYGRSTRRQEFTYAMVNQPNGAATERQLVTFSDVIPFTQGDFITFDPVNSTFEAKIEGLYEVSSNINYNPNNAAPQSGGLINQFRRSFLNFIVQVKRNGQTNWTDLVGTRTGWGDGAAALTKTVSIQNMPVDLKKGDQIRFVILNPFTDNNGNLHATSGNAYIGTETNLPTSKSFKIQLLDYNL